MHKDDAMQVLDSIGLSDNDGLEYEVFMFNLVIHATDFK